MEAYYRISLEAYSMEDVSKLCGIENHHLELLDEYYHVNLMVKDNAILLLNKEEQISKKVEKSILAILSMIGANIPIDDRDIIYVTKLVELNKIDQLSLAYAKPIGKTIQGKLIYPKTIGQRYLCRCMEKEDIVFASGVAGTGKTYLAVVYAATLLKKNEISKIILTRPAVEAGENLGFLPGDLKEKVDPYLRPLYDALYDVLGQSNVDKLLEKEVIEIAPLAYMRGRTLDQAFIILDEAQNTTKAQMKMFLTRMGFHSKIVITGDLTQVDLIKKSDSGLMNALSLLQGIEGIGFAKLTTLDVVRNPLVQK
ncbi:MAG: PhoH family protein, partial [Erysipelotrichaceae bacterium]